MLNKRKTSVLIGITVLALIIMGCTGTINITKTAPPTISIITATAPGETATIPPVTPEAPTTAPTQAATEAPVDMGQISLVDINGFKDQSNYWYFSGLLHNDTPKAVSDIQIEVTLIDTAGTEVYSYTTYSMLAYLLPGESSPFSYFTTEPFENGQTVQASIVGYTPIEAINRANLEFRGVTLWADEYNDVYLAGEVVNNNAEPVNLSGLAGTLSDANGKLVTASAAYPYLTYIAPNSNSPFVMMFDAPLGMAPSLTNYNLYSDGLSTNAAETYNISISEQQTRYQDSNGKMHLVGTITNHEAEPMNIYLVAGMYDKDGNCVDANVVYLPMPLNAGETFPYDFSLWGAVDYVPAAQEAATGYEIFIDWLATSTTGSGTYSLSTRDDTNAFDGTKGNFSGTVVNTTGQDLTAALVSVSLYDKGTGQLMATNLNFVADTLAKDTTGTYEVSVYTPSELDPANVEIKIIALGQ